MSITVNVKTHHYNYNRKNRFVLFMYNVDELRFISWHVFIRYMHHFQEYNQIETGMLLDFVSPWQFLRDKCDGAHAHWNEK